MLHGGVSLNAGATRDRTAVNGGDALHLTALSVAPAVIRADEAGLTCCGAPIGGGTCSLVNPAEREGGAAMDAKVGEGGDGLAEAGEDEGFACEADGEWSVGQFAALADGHPGRTERLVEGRLTSGIKVVGARLARECRLAEAAHRWPKISIISAMKRGALASKATSAFGSLPPR